MAKKNNYYVVKKGNEIGIFDNWADCSKQVYGFSGAIYKGFEKLDEAEAYFAGQESRDSIRFETAEELMTHIDKGEMIAYVDGSNKGDGSAFSWGIVTFSHELGKVDLSGMSTKEDVIQFRNVAGELFAAVGAIRFAIAKGMDKLFIYHDYSGIRHFALNEWELKNHLSQGYNKFYNSIKDKIVIEFVKVEGHTDDKFNEEADVLAKAELGIEK